jgi:hypothetical protein
MRARIRKENEKKDVKSALPAYPPFSTTPSPTTSSCQFFQTQIFGVFWFPHVIYSAISITYDITDMMPLSLHRYPDNPQAGPSSP